MQYTLQKIKKWFFSNLTKKRVLISIFLLLIIPLISDAMIGVDITGFFSTMLEGISETAIPFKLFFIFLFLLLLVSQPFLKGSVWLLERAANPAHLEIMESELVQVGWQFTSSLANTAIIIILIIIGIATILNKDSYEAKKTLPKLIIAALLVNFSLVFVGVVVDISNIILMTFYRADIGKELVSALTESWGTITTSMGAYLAASLTAFSIPFSAPFAQLAFITSITGMFLPQLIDAVMQTIITFLVAGTLLTYSILFLARIFIIQILAIFSPIAFVARVLPKTKNLWEDWLKTLVEWALLGVILLFLLSLSTIAVEPLRPEHSISVFESVDKFTGQIATIFIYYFTLVIFLIVSFKISRNYMPQGAQAVIDGVKNTVNGLKSAATAVAPMTKPIKEEIDYYGDKDRKDDAQEQYEKEKEQFTDNFSEADGLIGKAKVVSDFAKSRALKNKTKFARRVKHIGSTYGKKYDDEELMKDKTNEELVKKLNRRHTPDHVKDKVANILAGREGDFDQIRDVIVENWNRLGKDTKKEINKSHPDIHVDVNPEEGKDKMIEEINKMSGSDVKEIKFDDIQIEYKGKIAAEVAKNTSNLDSLSDASRSKKKAFVDALVQSNDENAANLMANYFDGKPKRIEKWAGEDYDRIKGFLKDQGFKSETSSETDKSNDENNSSTVITPEKDRKKKRKENWEKNKENWDNI